MSLWKAGQSFLAKIDYFFKVDHISKKLTLALFDIRPTTHLVCTLTRNDNLASWKCVAL